MKKPKTVNVFDAYNIEIKQQGRGEFVIVITNEKLKIRVPLSDWWIQIIAEEMWDHISLRQEQINDISKAMRGEK